MSAPVEFTGGDVREARHRLGLSPSDLAFELGIDPTTVYKWERGAGNLKPIHYYAIRGLEAARKGAL